MSDSRIYRFEDQFEAVDAPEQLQAVDQKLVTIGQLARKCLSHSDFQQYKDTFEAELQNIMNAMVIYTANFGKRGDTLEQYAVNMIRFVQRITDLRKLLTYVESDARQTAPTPGDSNGKK